MVIFRRYNKFIKSIIMGLVVLLVGNFLNWSPTFILIGAIISALCVWFASAPAKIFQANLRKLTVWERVKGWVIWGIATLILVKFYFNIPWLSSFIFVSFGLILVWWISTATKLRKENIEKRRVGIYRGNRFVEGIVDTIERGAGNIGRAGEKFMKHQMGWNGGKKEIKCSKCDGQGVEYFLGGDAEDCPVCHGEGIIGYIED